MPPDVGDKISRPAPACSEPAAIIILRRFLAPGMPPAPSSYRDAMPSKRPEPSAHVGVIMGSRSDWPVMSHAAEVLRALSVSFEAKIVSAHRTPERLYAYATSAKSRGLKVIIAGAGGAAHLPGMTASMTTLPVLGVPVEATGLQGLDALLSIVQMPGGVPVGTLAIGKAGATNAGILAASILALNDAALAKRLDAYRAQKAADVPENPIEDSGQSMLASAKKKGSATA